MNRIEEYPSILTEKEQESLRGAKWYEEPTDPRETLYHDFRYMIDDRDDRLGPDDDFAGVQITVVDDGETLSMYSGYIMLFEDGMEEFVDLELIPENFQEEIKEYEDRIFKNIMATLEDFEWRKPTPEESILHDYIATRMTPA